MKKILLLALFSIVVTPPVLSTPPFNSPCDQFDWNGDIGAAYTCRQEENKRNRQLQLMEQQVQLQQQQVQQQQQYMNQMRFSPMQPSMYLGPGVYY